MKKYQFPVNFWWGLAASDPRTKGRTSGDKKGEDIPDYWRKKEPQKSLD